MSPPLEVDKKIQELVHHVSRGCMKRYEGRWTLSVYDSAWVSMVKKPDGNWLFPQAFRYVLSRQEEGSGWLGHGAEIDAILNTMAALLSIEKHLGESRELPEADISHLKARECNALAFLRTALQAWDVNSCMHVGFELLVPALLAMLSEHGIDLDFPDREALSRFNQEKMKRFKPEMLYGPLQTTALHSLESFIGQVDFSKLGHHLVAGSMLGSPSATAAYLINIKGWSNDCERYLRDCIEYGGGNGCGGVPSAYPCEVFEFAWTLTTLIHAGYDKGKLMQIQRVSGALDSISSQLQRNNGTIGFSAGMLADSDDTSKCINLLNIMGRRTSADAMIAQFLSLKGHMMTYMGERNLSPSANCNALLCILDADNIEPYLDVVGKITATLCDSWWSDTLCDKWNLSVDYTSMLMAQTFSVLLQRRDAELLPKLLDALIRERVLVVLVQLLNRYLSGFQSLDLHSTRLYVRCTESAAYAVLACAALRTLPYPENVLSRLDEVIAEGKEYLHQREEDWGSGQYLWIEKVTYGSSTLSEAYCLAAIYVTTKTLTWGDDVKDWFRLSSITRKLTSFLKLVHRGPTPAWIHEACALEGATFAPMLRSTRGDIFPLRDGYKDDYIDYIPVAWTYINNTYRLRMNASILWDMMSFSLLDFLVDEYMETKVASLGENARDQVKGYIKRSLSFPFTPEPGNGSFSSKKQSCPEIRKGKEPSHAGVESVKRTLDRYVREIMLHAGVRTASQNDLEQLRRELQDFLLAHIAQMEDNAILKSSDTSKNTGSGSGKEFNSKISYFQWSRTTGSQHISCPVSFAFYCCLLTRTADFGRRRDCFPTPVQKYLAADLCGHLAVMSRMLNDYASVIRDRREGNLNSVNFPEFQSSTHSSAKASLLHLGEHERQASRSALRELLESIHLQDGETLMSRSPIICRGMELFAYVTELFADMYVAKDLTNAAQ